MRIENLCKTYKIKKATNVNALSHVSLELPETGMVFLLGKSGSGKTTLLKLLAGLDAPTEGEIYFHGKDLAKCSVKELDSYRNTYCGFIFQEYNLIPELNVEDNISLSLSMQGERDTREKVEEVLRQVELGGYEKRKISELSGGQRQRVAIARAIIKHPEIIFADEPTGALDQKTGNAILSLLKTLSKEHLVFIVTHDRESAQKYGDRIIELQDGEVIADSAPFKSTEEKADFSLKRAKLPFKTAFKVGSGNFKFHPLRVAVAVLLSALILLIFSASFSLAITTKESLSADATYISGVEGTFIEKTDETGQKRMLSKDDLDLMQERFQGQVFAVVQAPVKLSDLEESEIFDNSIRPYGYALIHERQLDLIATSVNGRFPIGEGEVMIPRLIAEKLLSLKGFSEISALLGTTLTFDEMPLTVCAILDTEFDEFLYLSAETEIKEYSDLYLSMKGISKKGLRQIFSMGKENFSYELRNRAVTQISELKSLLETFREAFVALSVVCGFLSAAIFVYFVSQSISYQTELILLLRLLGFDNGNISRIFLCETFLLGLMVYALSIGGCAVIYLLLNRFLLSSLTLFGIGWIEPLLLLAIDCICILSGTLLPLRKQKNISPSEVLESER